MKHGAFAILSGLSILFFACGADGEDYQPVSHAAFLQTHAYAVGQRRLVLRDPQRNRPLKTEIWYPAEDTTRPEP